MFLICQDTVVVYYNLTVSDIEIPIFELWEKWSTPPMQLVTSPLLPDNSTCYGLSYRLNRPVLELLKLDWNTWNHETVCKLFVLVWYTWNHINMCKQVILKLRIVIWNYIIAYILLVLNRNTWNYISIIIIIIIINVMDKFNSLVILPFQPLH